jgi:hypothetical protein
VKRRALQLLATAHLLPCFLSAGEVRLSFLREISVQQETARLLKELNCQPVAVVSFQKAVEHYYANGFQLDLSKFPNSSNGWYSFQSPSRLVAALPHKLEDLDHSYELNCFDTVILLSSGYLRSRLKPDDLHGAILAPERFTNSIAMSPTATARDAFAVMYPAWYREATAELWPSAFEDSRITLATVLFR